MLANKHQFDGAMAPGAQPNAFRRRMCANNPDSPPHALPCLILAVNALSFMFSHE
jgi:hypothetical protein